MNQAEIIDCHTHCYPSEVSKDPRTWAEANNEMHWANLTAPSGRNSIQGWATHEQMLSDMDVAGIQTAFLLGWYWENESTCRWHNQVIAEWVAKAPERFVGFASIYPNGDTLSQLEEAKSLGLRGVGEMHPGVQQFDANSPGWQLLADWCIQSDWPVNLHATEAAGHPHPGNVPTPFHIFVQMAEQAPELKIVLAHWGGGLPFFEQNPRLRKLLSNVYYDTSASPLLYDHKIFKRVIDLVGPKKILYGSDYPLRVFPREQTSPDFRRFIQVAKQSIGPSPEFAEPVFHQNARDLLSS
ncbi:MAG: amidohydrolase family protein [Verrucomicrobiota bacterium]